MAKVSTVNVATVGNDIGYGLYPLSTLLLANGWTLQSCGTGAAGVRRTVGPLSQAEWIAAANTWQIMYRGNVYVTFLRVSATSLTTKFAVVSPATAGSATVPDAQVTATNEVSLAQAGLTGSTRAHAITYSDDQNAVGIRSFYLLFTDGTATLRGSVVLEALADDTYDPANAAPYVVMARADGLTTSVGAWSWWYSPTSVWATITSPGIPYSISLGVYTFASGASLVGVSPWSALDQGISIPWGRNSAAAVAPGHVGMSNTLKARGVARSYPSTVNLASGAYVYALDCLVPWEDGTAPL
jgi:hypothetical protein